VKYSITVLHLFIFCT